MQAERTTSARSPARLKACETERNARCASSALSIQAGWGAGDAPSLPRAARALHAPPEQMLTAMSVEHTRAWP